MKKFFAILTLLILCVACGTIKYVPIVQHDTTTVYKNRDVLVHDSISVYKDRFIYTKGDTVYNTTVEYKDRWKSKEVHDTTYIDREVYVDKPVEVEKPLSKVQKLLIALGKIFAIVLIIALGYLGYKLYRKFKIV